MLSKCLKGTFVLMGFTVLTACTGNHFDFYSPYYSDEPSPPVTAPTDDYSASPREPVTRKSHGAQYHRPQAPTVAPSHGANTQAAGTQNNHVITQKPRMEAPVARQAPPPPPVVE